MGWRIINIHAMFADMKAMVVALFILMQIRTSLTVCEGRVL